ncbi:hypothetical protein ACHAQA_000265 [Verticillium albo-atrum]
MARKSTPRVRTGCKTCRIRRVKCDETKPNCLKCTQTGRTCDGYEKHMTVMSTPIMRASSSSSASPPPGLIAVTAYSIPFRMPGSQRDRQLLHYFCVQGAHEFSGFVHNEFWARTALYASQNETIVRQSLIALSSLHLDLARPGATGTGPGSGAGIVGNDTLLQYGKALRSLQTRITKSGQTAQARFETAKTSLICCILFYCFESSMGDTQAAMGHLDNGLRLFASHRRAHAHDDDEEMASLSDTLGRLDMQATFFDDGRLPTLALVSPTERETGLLASGETQTPFFKLGDAQKLLIKLSNWLVHFLLENLDHQYESRDAIPAAVLAEKDRLTVEFDLWAQQCDAFMRDLPSPVSHPAGDSDRERDQSRAARTLQAQHGAMQMLLASKIPSRPEIFGTVPNLAGADIVQLCESVLLPDGHGEAAAAAASTTRSLSSETGVVVPLFLLAMKCADESVTDKAVELLVRSQRREGLYDAVAAASLVGKLKGIMNQRRHESEELGLGSSREDSLEHWVADLLDQAPGGVSRLTALL